MYELSYALRALTQSSTNERSELRAVVSNGDTLTEQNVPFLSEKN
jgi:hypothetical protein